MSVYDEAIIIMEARFKCDCLISIATVKDGRPYVRTVDAYYENGAFYTITYALSQKILHIKDKPETAVCGEWFSGCGLGENLGHVLSRENAEIMTKLRAVFAKWYDNGHTNEDDPNTCILRITLTEGILQDEGERYNIDFKNRSATTGWKRADI